MKKIIKLNEAKIRKMVAESLKNVMEAANVFDFASDKPQYDLNSPEWEEHHNLMKTDARQYENELEYIENDINFLCWCEENEINIKNMTDREIVNLYHRYAQVIERDRAMYE